MAILFNPPKSEVVRPVADMLNILLPCNFLKMEKLVRIYRSAFYLISEFSHDSGTVSVVLKCALLCYE